ncbi:MAG TPA: peptidylprolyl isomerase [Magnetovibrio sp.]
MTRKQACFGIMTEITMMVVAATLSVVAPAWADDVSGAGAKSATNPVAARVNGHVIHLSDVETARGLLPPKMQSQPLDVVYPVLLDSLINSHLAAEKARKLGFDETPEYKERMARLGEQILERMMLTRHIEQKLTEELLQERFEVLRERAANSFEVHARHILVDTEAVGLTVVQKLKDGEDFVDLSKTYSIDPNAAEGGDLGWFGPGRMVRAFENAAMVLPPGAFTEKPIKTKYGWHVIMVEERRPLPIPTFAQARTVLVNELSAELGQTLMEELRAAAEVKKFDLQSLK